MGIRDILKPANQEQAPAKGEALGADLVKRSQQIQTENAKEQAQALSSLEVGRAYQENRRKAGEAIRRVLHGTAKGENVFIMLAIMAEALEALTSQPGLAQRIEENIKTIYAEGLAEREALEAKADYNKRKLEKVQKALGGVLSVGEYNGLKALEKFLLAQIEQEQGQLME